MKNFLRYFLQGLLYVAPLAITTYVFVTSIKVIDKGVDDLLHLDIPGLGIVIAILTIALVGYLGSTYIAQSLLGLFERLMEKAPLIKLVYTSIKDLISAFVGEKKKFDQPVLVNISRDNHLQKLGFITQHDLSRLGIGSEKVAVYLPHSYNFSGNLFIVNSDQVTTIEGSSSDIMKFIVSGGVSTL